jgi:hypothetical protein
MTNPLDLIIKSPVNLSPREKEFIETTVMGQMFPWYYIGQQTMNKSLDYLPEQLRPYHKHINPPFLSHILLMRTEEELVDHLSRPINQYSESYEFFIEIFHRFMVENGLKYKKIFRANLNLTWYHGLEHTEPHRDHDWPHYNFIMYLNTCENGETIIWPDDFSTSYAIPCEQYTAITFREMWHAHRFPPIGARRVVFVVTYA